MLLRALCVFVAVAVGDVCWARWSAAVSRSRRWPAAWWSVAVYALSSQVIIEYTHNHWMLAPAFLGAFVGTALGVGKKE